MISKIQIDSDLIPIGNLNAHAKREVDGESEKLPLLTGRNQDGILALSSQIIMLARTRS